MICNYDKIKTLKTNIIFDGLYSASIGYFDKILEPLDPIDADTIYSVQEIIGKDASVAQVLIYGKTIDFVSPANISSRETLVEITPENSVNESGNFDAQTIVE